MEGVVRESSTEVQAHPGEKKEKRAIIGADWNREGGLTGPGVCTLLRLKGRKKGGSSKKNGGRRIYLLPDSEREKGRSECIHGT